MGVINSLPITTVKIPELPAYGAVDLVLSPKDLIEITKNTGTYAEPVYASDASKKIPLEDLETLLGIGSGGLVKAVEYVSVLDNRTTSDTFTNIAIELEDDKKYFILEVLGRPTTTPFASGFNVQFPTTPPDGFCVFICFITNWHSTNNFDDYKFASGFTYLCTWSEELEEWLYDKQKSITKHKNSYIWLDAYGAILNLQIYEGGQTFYIKWASGYSAGQTLFCILPPLRYNIGETVEFVFLDDMPPLFSIPERFKFIGWTGGDMVQDRLIVANDGDYTYRPPLNLKRGTIIRFKAIWDYAHAGGADFVSQAWVVDAQLVM